MKPELPPPSKILGSDDLLARFELGAAYQRFCGPKRPKEDLSSFLTNIYGISNLGIKDDQSSSLMRLVEKPPITGKEIVGLSTSALSGFKLAPGPMPDNCKFFDVLPGDAALLSISQSTSVVVAGQPDNGNSSADATKQRKRLKRSLDVAACPEPEKKAKKHRSGEEKDKRQKKKKSKRKERKNKKQDLEGADTAF